MADNAPELGKLAGDDDHRDAIHVAVAPVVADTKLAPGQDIGIISEGRAGVVDKPSGIVDPFLTSMVFPEQRFWMFLYPNTVTGMRHHWSHPAFGGSPEPGDSEAWLREFAEKAGMSYEVFRERLEEAVSDGMPWVERDSEYARDAYYDVDEATFWKHVKAVFEIDRPEDEYFVPFTCSC